jgi:hypothetical protein
MTLRSILLLLSIAGLLGAVVFAPSMGGGSLWAATLHNLAHGPIFGCVALIALIGLRGRAWFALQGPARQYLIAFAATALLGAATELAQVPTGRDASWFDLGNDVLGAIAFLSIFAAFDQRRAGESKSRRQAFARLLGLAALAVLFFPLAWTGYAYARRASAFPEIANFAEGIDGGFLHSRYSHIEIAPLPEPWAAFPNERALRIEFQPASWPGIEFKETPPDWRGYDALILDVTNPQRTELEFLVRIDDRAHNWRLVDRYNRRLRIAPATRTTFRIPLSDIETAPRDRTFDLRNVARMLVFQSKNTAPEVMYLSRVWLQRTGETE